jgi:hypothetical protein
MLLKEVLNTLSVTGSSKTIYYIYLILNHYLEVVFMDMSLIEEGEKIQWLKEKWQKDKQYWPLITRSTPLTWFRVQKTAPSVHVSIVPY